jgi:hypothetical protein
MREPRWNTSDGLKGLLPPTSIITAQSWKTFADAYDAEGARERRFKAWRTANPPKPAPSLLPDQLEDLACEVLCKPNSRSLFGEASRPRMESAEKLAKIVLGLLKKDMRSLQDLLAAVESRNSKRGPDQNPRSIAEAMNALLQFIRREKRLPGKAELNTEAQRVKLSKVFRRARGDDRPLECGTRVAIEDQSFRVVEATPWILRVCPTPRWNEPRWDKTTFSKEIIKPAGLTGLPRLRRS